MAEDGKKRHSSTGVVLKNGRDPHVDELEADFDRTQIHYSENEMKNLEEGLPMKLMKFMGLPKTYRQTLYKEFLADVNTISSIPTDTASTLLNLVSWVCGKNDGKVENTVVGDSEEKETLEWAREIHEVFNAAKSSSFHYEDEKCVSRKASNVTITTPFSSHATCDGRLCKASHILENSKQKQVNFDLEKPVIPAQTFVVQNVSTSVPVNNNFKVTKNNHEMTSLHIQTLHANADPTNVVQVANESSAENPLPPTSLKMNHPTETHDNEDYINPIETAFPESETNIYSFQYDEDEENMEEAPPSSISNGEQMQDDDTFFYGGVPATSETYIYSYQCDDDEEEMKNDKEFQDPLLDSTAETNNYYIMQHSPTHSRVFNNGGIPAISETNIYAYQYEEDEDDILEELSFSTGKSIPNESGEGLVISNVINHETHPVESKKSLTTPQAYKKESGMPTPPPKKQVATVEVSTEPFASESIQIEPTNPFYDMIQTQSTRFASEPLQKENANLKHAVQNDASTSTLEPVQSEPTQSEHEVHIDTFAMNNESTSANIDSDEEEECASVHSEESSPLDEDVHNIMVSDQDQLTDNEEPQLIISQTPPESVFAHESETNFNYYPEEEEAAVNNNTRVSDQIAKVEAITAKHQHQSTPNVGFTNYGLVEQRKTPSSIHISTNERKEPSYYPSTSASSHVLQSGMKSQLRPARKSSLKEVTFAPTCFDKEKESFSRKLEEKKDIPDPDTPKPTTSAVQMQLNEDLKTLEEIVKKLYKNLNKKGPLTIVANFKPTKDGELKMDLNNNNVQVQSAQTKLVLSSTQSLINVSPNRKEKEERKEEKVVDLDVKVDEREAAPLSIIQTPTKPTELVVPSITTSFKKSTPAPINLSAKPIKSSLSFKSKPIVENKAFQLETKMDTNNNIRARIPNTSSNTVRPTKRVSLDLCSTTSECKRAANSKPIMTHAAKGGDAEKNRPRQKRLTRATSEHPPPPVPYTLLSCYANKADTISIKATRGCQFHPESQTNLRVIRKCNSHTIQLEHGKEEQHEHIKESTSEASTSDASSLTSESTTGNEINEEPEYNNNFYTSAKMDSRSRSTASASQSTTFNRGEQGEGARTIRTKVYIPAAPASQRKTSYRDIFREKRNQQQAQTVYVDLTSKGRNGPQTLKSRSTHNTY